MLTKNRGRNNSQTFRHCMDQLKELASEAENVLETYALEVESKREGKSLKKKLQRYMCILCECDSVHEVGKEIKHIRSSLSDLTAELASITGGGGEASSALAEQEQTRLSRLRYAHEVDQHFVGMEKDIHSVPLISICGMRGLGKTTLTRKIYHHQDVQHHFAGRAWVCVTQQFQPDTILKEIIEPIGGNMVGSSNLVVQLHSALKERKCLIVIDDIWETHHWNTLMRAFPTNNCQCQVILTTRNEKIASHDGYVHKLSFLSEDEGWELLQKIAFPKNDGSTHVLESRSSFEDIGSKIVQKCGCLPLAISVIGGILRQKQQVSAEWEKVSMNMDAYLKHEGEGIADDTNTKVKLVLDLSFDVLPYYLKSCFLYLACFPEDEDIETERLNQLWMAEGLISFEEKGNSETLRDVAERYLSELAFRCMVQVESGYFNTPHNKFESCRLHDLMHDLCSSKAEEENFVKRVDFPKHVQDIPSAIGASIHRVAINLVDNDDATIRKLCMTELKNLRSFLFLSNLPTLGAAVFANILNLENSKHLKILMLDGVEFEDGNLLSTVDKHIYLKYLSLRRCNVQELQQHICNLPFLQTLDLREMRNTMKLPNLIWKMKRLRHLFLPEEIEVIGGDKLKLDGLNELETLRTINTKSVCIADVINLTSLRTVHVVIEEDMDGLSEIVEYLRSNECKLQDTSLDVRSCELTNVLENLLMIRSLISLAISNSKTGCNFPLYKQGMGPNLVSLEVGDCKFVGDVMDVLGKFPMLRILWLWLARDQERVNVEMRCGPNSFSELKRLILFELDNLDKWEVEKGAMPKLASLHIVNCKNLEKLPDGLNLSTLEELNLSGLSEEFNNKYKRGGENGEGKGQYYANISHIPCLYIY